MAQPKYHWAIPIDDTFRHPNAWKHRAGGRFVQACGRAATFAHVESASAFVDRGGKNPDWMCSTCATKARLALAKESAPKPSEVVWPKPRPIAEAPRTTILAWFPGTDMFNEGWEIVFPSDEGWITGREGHQPTHFLPLPPEVK